MEREVVEEKARKLMKDAGVDNHLTAKYRKMLYEKFCEQRKKPNCPGLLKGRVSISDSLKLSALATVIFFLKQNKMDLTIEMIAEEGSVELDDLPKPKSIDELVHIHVRPFSECVSSFAEQLTPAPKQAEAPLEYRRPGSLAERFSQLFPDYSSSEEDDESFY